MNSEDNSRWQMSAFRFGQGAEALDKDAEVLTGVAVVTEGPTNDKRFTLDAAFLDAVVEQGNAMKMGAKVRFGHPNMCSNSLGTYLGRAKNFRRDGQIVRADIHFSETSHHAPGGDLGGYIMELAATEPDMFGTSIVFERGEELASKRDGSDESDEAPPVITCGQLLAVDVVDDPAANKGLYGEQFSSDTLAEQVTEFLDSHPEVMEILSKQPQVVTEFLARYERYRAGEQGETEMDNEQVNEEVNAALDAQRAEFAELNDEFGADIAVEAFLSCGGRDRAVELQAAKVAEELAALKAENEALKAKVESHDGDDGVPASPTDTAGDEQFDIKAEVERLKSEGMKGSEAWRKVQVEHPDAYNKHIFGE